MAASIASAEPYVIIIDETTLSLAMNPAIRAVTILQSSRPMGLNIGAITPAMPASMLCSASATMMSCQLNA